MPIRLATLVLFLAAACGAPDPTCDDGEKNGAETDIDCGGTCGGCEQGEACSAGGDCESGACDQGACVAAPACDDFLKNADESDVDCGGSCAAKCADGKGCNAPSDCASGTCEESVCVTPSACDDQQKNGDETGVDCGGSCDPCADGGGCLGDADCAAGLSCQNLFCAPKALACFEGLECTQQCTGTGAGACQMDCLQRMPPGAQTKLSAFTGCINTGCPTQGGGICDRAAAGHDAAACNACVEALLEEGGECEDELFECVLDEV